MRVMNTKSLEQELRSWKPRSPSLRLRRRLFETALACRSDDGLADATSAAIRRLNELLAPWCRRFVTAAVCTLALMATVGGRAYWSGRPIHANPARVLAAVTN